MAKVTDFAEELSSRYEINPEEASAFVNLMFDIINDELDSPDKQVKVKGLGTFKVTSVGARASVDVNTGERIILEGRNKISFTPEVLLRDRVNRPFVQFETVVLNDGVDFSDIDREFEEKSKQEVAEEGDESATDDENAIAETEEETIDESDVAEQADANESVEHEPYISVEHEPYLSVEPESEEALQESAEQAVSTELNVESQTHQEVVGEEENVEAEEENVKQEENTDKAEEETVETENNEDDRIADADETVATEDEAETTESADDAESTDVEAQEEKPESSNDKDVVAQRVNVGCKQRNPRLMYWLSTASFALLVCIGIGMYFLYRQIEEKNKAIEQLQSRLTVHAAIVDDKAEKPKDTALPIATPQKKQQESQQPSDAASPQNDNKAEATDKAVGKDKAENSDGLKAKNKTAAPSNTDAASKNAADKKQAGKDVANKKTPAADKSSLVATAPSDYNYDVRIRTGAYIIVGTDRVVTVRQGQTLASISKANLGPGMECYVEVYNKRKQVKAGDKIKIPKLKLKKLR